MLIKALTIICDKIHLSVILTRDLHVAQRNKISQFQNMNQTYELNILLTVKGICMFSGAILTS